MAKLSKTEIRALAYEISKEIIQERKQEIENEKESLLNAFYETELGIAIKFVNEHEDMKNNKISDYAIDRLANVPINYRPGIEDIERKLIIKQIDCSNIEELISTVKQSFLN